MRKKVFFPSVFWISQLLFAPSGQGQKRFPGRAVRHLSPHLLHPHVRQPNTMFVRNGAVTPGLSCECDISFRLLCYKGRPKSAQQLHDSTVAARRAQHRTVIPGDTRIFTLKSFMMVIFWPPKLMQEKRAQRITFWVRGQPGGVGVFHLKGWWSKSSYPPSKVCFPWVSSGMPQEFCQDVPDPWGCSKSLCKKKLMLIYRFLVKIPPRLKMSDAGFLPWEKLSYASFTYIKDLQHLIGKSRLGEDDSMRCFSCLFDILLRHAESDDSTR